MVIVLASVLAQALWQKARDELPFLLDPSAAAPARVSTADGMIAAMLFFVLQALGLIMFADSLKGSGGSAIVMVFGVAGALVYAIMRFVYWRAKTAGVPRLLAANWQQSTLVGLGAGLVTSMLGSAYLYVLQHTSMQSAPPALKMVGLFNLQWLFLLAVVAAPLAEEFIFRGLIFGGLRRLMGLLPAMVASAALFSIIHPPVAMLPVFVLGLCTAFAYERTKTLFAPMLTHAIYNAVVLVLQLQFH